MTISKLNNCSAILIWLMCCIGIINAGPFGRPCKSSGDCGQDFCCAFRVSHKAGFCMPTKKLGELCSISFMRGDSFTCGCQLGLTCAIVERDKKTKIAKTRCVQIPKEGPEIMESKNENVTQTMTRLLTGRKLERLLKLLSETPAVKKT